MAETKDEKKKAEKKEPVKNADAKKKGSSRILVFLILVVGIAVIAVLSVVAPNTVFVPFSTFKANFNNAPKVSIVGTYWNSTQYALESTCLNSVVETIAYSRARSTINFYLINMQSNTCAYSKNGLVGLQISIVNGSAGQCRSLAASNGAALYLNYSNTNITQIYPNKMYVYGNSQYLNKCPIALSMA